MNHYIYGHAKRTNFSNNVNGVYGQDTIGVVKLKNGMPLTIFMSLDGHGTYGHRYSKLAYDLFHTKIKTKSMEICLISLVRNIELRNKALTELFESMFQAVDDQLNAQIGYLSGGSTASIVVKIMNIMICANVGDSSVYLKQGKVIELISGDHSPENPEEWVAYSSRVARLQASLGQPVDVHSLCISESICPGSDTRFKDLQDIDQFRYIKP